MVDKLREHRWKIVAMLIGPMLGFAVWAADAFVGQKVQDKVQVLDTRLLNIEKQLSAIQQELKDLKSVP